MSTIDGYWFPFGTPTAARGAAHGFWCSHSRQGALWCAARATGSRSGTWVPDLRVQKLTSTTEVPRTSEGSAAKHTREKRDDGDSW